MFLTWVGAIACAVAGAVLVIVGETLTGIILVVVGVGLGALAVALGPVMKSSRAIAEQSGMEVNRITGAPKMGAAMRQANERTAAALASTASLMGVGLSTTGTPSSAVVVAAADTGERSNLNPVYRVELDVAATAGGRYTTTVMSEVNSLAIAQCVPGTAVAVKIDPADRNNVWIDWLAVAG